MTKLPKLWFSYFLVFCSWRLTLYDCKNNNLWSKLCFRNFSFVLLVVLMTLLWSADWRQRGPGFSPNLYLWWRNSKVAWTSSEAWALAILLFCSVSSRNVWRWEIGNWHCSVRDHRVWKFWYYIALVLYLLL